MAKTEKCFGIIPFRLHENRVEVLLIKHVKGSYWAFPKGHGDEDENPQVTAQRELFEETDLRVHSFLSVDYPQEDYQFVRDGEEVHKFVTYYPAVIEGEVSLKESHEVSESLWIGLKDAAAKITFEGTQKLFQTFLERNPDLELKVQED